jgi:hypothetical protein
MGEFQAAPAGVEAHPLVGELAYVVAAGAGRVHLNGVGRTGLQGHLAKNLLGGGGTADVAQTHHQHSRGFCFDAH